MDNIEKKYYKIREVAEIIGLPISTLRFWERKFTIIKPKRNEHGTRFYTVADLERIRLVAFLVKEKGMKLEVPSSRYAKTIPAYLERWKLSRVLNKSD